MKIYNSLSREIEEVIPREPGKIGMYTCGPTVYSTATIANFRTYMLSDWLNRSLRYLGYEVTSVMNLTDVGHLTGDNEGDADRGEDRLEKASRKEGRTAWEIAEAYGTEFVKQMAEYNLLPPSVICKATEHIPEQIAMIQKLAEQGWTYTIPDGVYFDTAAYERAGHKYGQLSNLEAEKVVARVEENPDKRSPRDFALWKLSPKGGAKRQMEWDSPWGVGFPGWHIECSAMSTKYLGDQFDFHVGGEDLKSTHHPNEIAQAEGATGKEPFVKYWVHGAFILVDGGRMGKSEGNAYTLDDLKGHGFEPLALRYFYLTGHYRRQLNFTWEALTAAETALGKLREVVRGWRSDQVDRTSLSEEKRQKIDEFQGRFREAIENDLNLPEALAIGWELTKSNLSNYDKLDLLTEFDQVWGLNLKEGSSVITKIPPEVVRLKEEREEARQKQDYARADQLRQEIERLGYRLEDRGEETKVAKNG